MRRADGAYRAFFTRVVPVPEAETGAVREWVGICTDITERKQAEEASARLAAIVTSADDAIVGKTLEGIVTSWNAGAERMFGYTAEEMIGQPILRLIPADRLDEEDRILARLRGGERIEHFETVREAKDGRTLNVSLTISPVRNEAGIIIGASKIARNVTERKQAEAAVRETDEHLRAEVVAHSRQLEAIFEAAADGIVIYDDSGSLVQWNAATAQIFEFDRMPNYAGLPVGERPARLRVRDAHDQPIAAERLPFMRAVRGETLTGPRAVDLVITTPSGTEKYVSASSAPLRDESGRTIGAVTVYRDVTERRTLEHQARESAERLQLALDASSSGTFIWYPAEDRGEPDAQMLRLFGQPPDGTLNLAQALATMIHPDDGARYAEAVARSADPDGSGELREDIRVLLPDGSQRWLAITAQVFFEGGQGEPRHATRMAGTATDITERKRLEQRTHEALDALLAMANASVGVDEGAATNEAAAMRQVVLRGW